MQTVGLTFLWIAAAVVGVIAVCCIAIVIASAVKTIVNIFKNKEDDSNGKKG